MLGKVFNKSWKEYWSNFVVIAVLFIILYAVPEAIFTSSMNKAVSYSAQEGFSLEISWMIITIIFFIIFWLASFVFTAGIISSSLKGKKFTFFDFTNNLKGNYWRFVGFSLVLSLFLIGLFFLLIVPGVIFGIFWVLSGYVFINERKGIMKSLRRSRELVRGRWWRTFGYTVLLIIILLVISIIFSIFLGVVAPSLVQNQDAVSPIMAFLSTLVNLVPTAFTLPFAFIFYKNLYLEYKKKK